MGNGEKVFFWKDVWLGANNLAHKYSQIFQNALHTQGLLCEGGGKVGGGEMVLELTLEEAMV